MKITKHLVFAIFLLLAPVVAHAQTCVAVSPSGSGNHSGSDWNNAMAGLPSPMVRGATYYLADGTYPSYYEFSVPVSGTTTVTVKKAVGSGDYGQNCSPSIAAGWNGSTMGSAQAIFQNGTGTGLCANFWIANTASTGYLTIDGQTGSGNNGSSYGIKFLGNYNNTECSQPKNVLISYGFSSRTATNITINHVEMIGSCGGLTLNSSYQSNCATISDSTGNGGYQKDDNNIYLHNCTNCTFNYDYIHNSSGVPFFLTSGNNGITAEYDYLWFNSATAAEHAESWSAHTSNSNITIAYSVYRDQMGNGVFVSLNSGTAGTDSNVAVYGNVIWQTPGNPYGSYSYGDGVFACINGNNCPGWLFYQNTIVNLGGVYDGVNYLNGATGSVQVENNLWYNSQTTSGTAFGGLPSGSVEDYNSFLNYAHAPGGSGSHDVKNTSAPTPFASWTTGNFTLASDNSNWGNRASLPTGNWNTDAAGNNFTTNRGAYQYGSGSGSAPTPPANLSVVSVN